MWYGEAELRARIDAAEGAEKVALQRDLDAWLRGMFKTLCSYGKPWSVGKKPAPVEVMVGMPKPTGGLRDEAPVGATILVSANALWNDAKREFRLPDPAPYGNIALDSSGFVAMKRYGGYRWDVSEYVEFASTKPWKWWAAMDYCCEPEIAEDRAEVQRRVDLTVETLAECREYVTYWQEVEGVHWATQPMPVLQGWRAEDYRRCVAGVNKVLGGKWPEVVGLGSVCRRKLHGPDGLLALLDEMDLVLPAGVRLHLFGVKSTALDKIGKHPRVASTDSCAWDMDARMKACKAGKSNTLAHRGEVMRAWYDKQEGRKAAAPKVGHVQRQLELTL